MRNSIALLFGTLLCACASSSDDLAKQYVVTYYDRNHDGIVDFELHHLPNSADADWAFSDTKFRGRYDLRIDWGYAFEKKRVDIPVPKNVKITPGKPSVSETQ